MAAEVRSELGKRGTGALTHVFLQAGVGAFAAAMTGYFWDLLGKDRPRIVVVEPAAAACLFNSAKVGQPSRFEGPLDTVMAGLACGEPSTLAWKILDVGADYFMTISDERAVAAMRA